MQISRYDTKKKSEISSRKIYTIDEVTLLQAKLARALRQRLDVKYSEIFNEKLVLTMSKDRGIFLRFLYLREWYFTSLATLTGVHLTLA